MAEVFEDTKNQIRNLPIAEKLRSLLGDAADIAGVTRVRVTSGGQAIKGSGGRRTGSTRHDLGMAADLQLQQGSRTLSFQRPDELLVFEKFISAAVAMGAEGVGAGLNYMGAQTIHVGYGGYACWGDDGKSANAPQWLRRAFAEGRQLFATKQLPIPVALDVKQEEIGKPFIVAARSGLRLRTGPDIAFDVARVLPLGQKVFARLSEIYPDWLQIDTEGDGLLDGYAFASYLKSA